MWAHYKRSKNISAWELQLQPRRKRLRDRAAALARVEGALRRLSRDPASRVELREGSLWATVFEETSYQVSTRHGRPLHPERAPPGSRRHPFPWKGVAYLRLRSYRRTTGAADARAAPAPGTADVALKMKAVDEAFGAGPLALPEAVGAAALTAKVEQDVHCDHARVTMSPLYRPVPPSLDMCARACV